MTDEQGDPRTSAEDEERVRRALAAAAGPETVPDAVAARLDDVLAGLVADRGDLSSQAPPPATTPPERRRRWPNVLVAAAVVSLLALGVGTLVRGATTGQMSQAGAGGQAASAPRDTTTTRLPQGSEASKSLAGLTAEPPRLRSATLARDVRRVAASLGVHADVAGPLERRASPEKAAPARPACSLPARPRGSRVIRVTLDGSPATLLLGPPRSGVREASVYSCGNGTVPLADLRVPVR